MDHYTVTLQGNGENYRSLTRKPLLSSLVRTSATADSFRNLMKMSNRMGSEMVRHLENDSRLNEDINSRPKTFFHSQLQRGQRFYEDTQYEVAIDIFRNINQEGLT